VGTHEGAIIMYDLKTASRLYVLEAHAAPVSAVAFAPDGRRLVTVSLVDSSVTVWKIGSSISGFFNVGGPPRQGGRAGEPYRRIPFVRPHRGECVWECGGVGV
jgi:WD40 repeat protein